MCYNFSWPLQYDIDSGALNSDLLRIAVSDRLWNNGDGFALSEAFFNKNVDISWRNESHYQNGKLEKINDELRQAIDRAFGDVSVRMENGLLAGPNFWECPKDTFK